MVSSPRASYPEFYAQSVVFLPSKLSALEHLASHQIVHRDLKPDNILLCSVDPAHVVLVDFSIAHHLPAVVAKTASIESDRTSPLAFPTGTTQFCSLSAHVGVGAWLMYRP